MSLDTKNVDKTEELVKHQDKNENVEMVFDVERQRKSSNNHVLRAADRTRPSQPQSEVVVLEFDNCSVNFGIVLDNKNASKSSGRSKVSLGNAQISKLLPNSPASLDNRYPPPIHLLFWYTLPQC